jgi:type VI secretion system protein ImpA
MAVEGLEVEALLAPLAANDGAGEDLREDFSAGSPYQKLRDARNDARAAERAQDTAADGDAAVPLPWREVKRIGIQVLSRHSKDFEVAAWLTEALVRLDGLAGLEAGARVIAGLAGQYWEQGFPRRDEDGWEARTAPIAGLSGDGGADGMLMQPLRRFPIWHRADRAPVGLHLYQTAERVAAIPADSKENKERREKLLKTGIPELAALENEARVDAKYLIATAVQAREAARAWAAMDAALSARLGGDSPSTGRVAEALGRIQELGIKFGGALPEVAEPPEPVSPEEAEAEMPLGEGEANGALPSGHAGPAQRPLRTRDDAIRQLEDLAEWFRRTEPHSPMAYTLDDAVRRARMPLPDLLAEVLPDAGQRKAMLTMLGIKALE